MPCNLIKKGTLALPANLLKKRFWHSSFPGNFAKFLRTHRTRLGDCFSIFVRRSFFGIKSFNYIFLLIYGNRMEIERENIFWFHSFSDICYTMMILILKWCFFYWILNVSCFSYMTFILYYIELWRNSIKSFFEGFSNLFIRDYWNIFFSIESILWLVFTFLPKRGLSSCSKLLLVSNIWYFESVLFKLF